MAGKLNEMGVEEQYVTSFYVVMLILFTVGYGDYVPVNSLEIVVNLMYMTFGVYFFSVTVSTL